MTDRAGMGQLVLPEEDADVLLVALLLETLEEGKDPDVAAMSAMKQLAFLVRLERLPRFVRIDPEGASRIEQQATSRLVARLGPGIDHPLAQGQRRIGDDQRLVVLENGAEAVAAPAGTPRIVEGEQGRGNRGGWSITAAAGGMLGEAKPTISM